MWEDSWFKMEWAQWSSVLLHTKVSIAIFTLILWTLVVSSDWFPQCSLIVFFRDCLRFVSIACPLSFCGRRDLGSHGENLLGLRLKIQLYNTAAILCCLAHAFQVFIPTESSLGGQPLDDSSLASHQKLHLELAAEQTESCSVRPRNLTQDSLVIFQRVLDSPSVHVCQPSWQAHKFTSILEEGEREKMTFHRVLGILEDGAR